MPDDPRVPVITLDSRAHSDAIFRSLLDAAPDAVVVVDARGRIVFVNQQTEQLFGWSRDALLGQTIEALIPERFHSQHVHHRQGFIQAPRVRAMGSGLTLNGRKRDGSEFPVEISLSPLAIEGEARFTSASIRDVTDRKQNEQKVRRIQEHLLSAVESIPGAFAIFDTRDELVLCNSTVRDLLGKALPGQLVGRTFEDVIAANAIDGTFDLQGGTAAALTEKLVAYHRSPDGAFELRTASGRNLRFVDRRTGDSGSVLTVFDVTDDVVREEELRRARAQAESASSAKSEFLASMSHELRTPLNAILGFAQLLQRDKKAPLSERHQERIGHVLKGGEHLLRLIDEVLDLARIESGHVSVSPEAVELAPVMAEVKSTLGPMAARAEIELVVEPLDPALPPVRADRTRLKQILMNYGSNALKYGKRKGTATFRAEVRDHVVRLSVTDDGIGIPEDKHDKIFKPFQRAGQETGPIEGTGIGLAITRQLAELMGGTVGFRSNQDTGSEFWLEMPIHRADLRAVDEANPSRVEAGAKLGNAAGPKFVVVYIEDNPSNIAFMHDLLGDFERVELLTAPTAEIGIELVRARQPHAVIMDINLPGMSGFEATRRLGDWPETRGIPVIALSAAAMIHDAGRVAAAGFYRYLTKPVKVDELAAVLEELIR